jgi:hypothetical protein
MKTNYYMGVSPYGRGVFAERKIKTGEEIMNCPCIKIEPEDVTPYSILNLYLYAETPESTTRYLALDYGSLINNNTVTPNAQFLVDTERSRVIISALQEIKKDEEIFINYGYEIKELPSSFQEKADKINKAVYFDRFDGVCKKDLIKKYFEKINLHGEDYMEIQLRVPMSEVDKVKMKLFDNIIDEEVGETMMDTVIVLGIMKNEE